MCKFFVGNCFLVGQVEASRVGGWYSLRIWGSPGAWIPLSMIGWSYIFMDYQFGTTCLMINTT